MTTRPLTENLDTSGALRAEYPWAPDRGDGTYRNPVLYADYSDPDVIRVGADYYLTASSFGSTPGLPILHSRDLVNWTLVNHALRNLPHPRFDSVQPGCGVWAPAIRHHHGRFWIFFGMPDEGIYVTTAERPESSWSEPHLLAEGKGLIDPCPLWDDGGRAYLVHAYAQSRSGIKHRLRVRPMRPDGSALLGEGEIIADGADVFPTIEGPKFLKRDGWYYVFAPAGGVEAGWQLALRSRYVYGPYEHRVLLHQGNTPVNGPHQGALIDTPDGEWWFLHFQDTGVYGRVVHLQPAEWHDGWPLLGVNRNAEGVGEPALVHPKPRASHSPPPAVPATSDEFECDRLGLQWQWSANHRDDWYSLTARPGHLRLYSQPAPEEDLDLGRLPHLLLQKLPSRTFTVETALEFAPVEDGEGAGLVVMDHEHAAFVVRCTGSVTRLVLLRNEAEAFGIVMEGDRVRLRMTMSDGGECRFAYSLSGQELWRDAGVSFTATRGAWIGAKLGIFSAAAAGASRTGSTDFEYFRFSSPMGTDSSALVGDPK